MQKDMLKSSPQDEESKILNVEKPKNEAKPEGLCQNLLYLPLELQAKIFDDYLVSKDRFLLRQVNSHFQVLLDDYIGFTVKIDEDDPIEKLDFISEVAIRKATIMNMSELKDPLNGELKPPVFADLFLYPQFIQSIFVMGNVEPDFLSEMIRQCKVLDVFELSSGSFIVNKTMDYSDVEVLPEVNILSVEPHKNVHFPRCRILKLLHKDTIISSAREVHTQAVLKIMKTVQSPFLERVVMQCWTTERFPVSRISLISAECLERNPSIRSYFVGILHDEHDTENHVPVPHQEDEDLREVIKQTFAKASRKMTVEKLGISTTSADMTLWKEFIKYQNNLVHISLTVDIQDGIFSTEMFLPCQNTVLQFVLRGKFLTTFDFHWLEDCHKLKEICLHNINEGDFEGPSVHAVNMSSIPAGVESLVLFQTISRTDEINAALRKLTKLDTLVLFKTGNTAGETGVDPELLKQILKCRTLQSLLLVRFVASSPEQATMLVKMMHEMNDTRNGNMANAVLDIGDMDDDDDELPPLVPIEDEVASGNNLEVAVKEPKSNHGFVDEDAAPICPIHPKLDENMDTRGPLAQRKRSANSINNNLIPHGLASSKSDLSGAVSDPIRPQEIEFTTTSNVNDLEGCCAVALVNSVPADKMEPNLLTDAADTKGYDDEGEEGVSIYPSEAKNVMKVVPANIGQVCHISDEDPIEFYDPSIYLPSSSEILPNPPEQVIDEHEDWEDVDDGDSEDDDESLWEYNFHDPGFIVGMENNNEIGLDLVGQAEAGQNFQLVLNLDNEEDLENMLGLLEPVADNNNNIAFGFILDGVIDIMNADTKRSRWIGVEDDDGHLTYTLKITID